MLALAVVFLWSGSTRARGPTSPGPGWPQPVAGGSGLVAAKSLLESQGSYLASPFSLFCCLSYGLFPSGLFSCVT